MIGKVNRAYRVWYVLRLNNGLPATGIASIDQTITIRNPGNTATMAAPAITEFGNGLYFFDISASFSNTHGAGTYGGAIEVDAPGVRDTALVSVDFFLRDFDDLAQPGDEMDLVVDAVDADALSGDAVTEVSTILATIEDQIRYIRKQIGGDPLQAVTHTRAVIGTPGSITTPDSEVDVVVTQVDANTATFEQQ